MDRKILKHNNSLNARKCARCDGKIVYGQHYTESSKESGEKKVWRFMHHPKCPPRIQQENKQ